MVLNYSCGNVPNEIEYKDYIDLFEQKELPYLIDSTFIRSTTEKSQSSMDTTDIAEFFESNREFGGGVTLFDVYRYYPHFQFSIDDNITAVVIEKVGGAGGVEKMFYLITYSRVGKIIDKALLAKEIGDCSRLQVWTGEISKNFEIYVTQKLFKGDCETDEYRLESTKKESYKLTNEGEIITP